LQFAEAQMIEVTKRAWSLMLNLEIKKYGTNDVTIGDDWVNAAVGISGSWRGSVSLLCPPVLARRWAALMFATAEDALTQADIDDATGEMANVLAGNLKVVWPGDSRLFPPEITLGPGNGPAKNSEITTVLAFEDMQLPFVVMMQKFHSSVGEAGG
jgi:CheY-specific phosphatase CheX